MNDNDPLLTIREVANRLRVRRETVRAWANSGVLPCYRLGARGDRRFKESDVRRFLEREKGSRGGGS